MKRCLVFCVTVLVTAAVALAADSQRGGLFRNHSPRSSRLATQGGTAVPDNARAPGVSTDPGGRSIEFNAAPLEMVFKVYSDLVNKTILKDPAAPSPQITLQPKVGQDLTDDEKVLAIETVLEMNGIHLEPYGEKFVRALPRKEVRKEGVPLIMDPDVELGESTRFVSLMLPFKNIPTDEAQKALESFKSANGILVIFERTNSILITDTEANVNRMREIAKSIDIATPVLDNVYVFQIKNAAAADIQKVLQEMVEDAKKLQEKAKQPANAARPATPATSRPGLLGRLNNKNAPAAPANNESLIASVSDADRGMIRGDVLIIADERSNKLIIKTQESNLTIFKKIIDELDIETTPPTVVKVYRLKYADSEDVADMINDLIGNAPSSKSSSKGSQNANSKSGGGGNLTRGTTTAPKKSVNQRTGDTQAGELNKENTTVLSDDRINGIVVMTQKELLPTVESIIKEMDIKLSQVLIETCIIEVGLGNNLKTGVDWVRGIQKKNGEYQQGLAGGGGDKSPLASSTNAISLLSSALPSTLSPGSAGLNYALFSERFDLSAVISLSQSDSRSKYIASPIVMTVDNKEATIEATQARKFLSNYQSNSSSSYYGSSVVPQYENKDIGITIKVTPKINPNGTVMLEVEEEYSQVGAKQEILDPSSSPVQIDTSLTRKMSADVLLENQQTVVLGGLTDTVTERSETGIPILKDIPWIGRYLFAKTEDSETRSELLVFMTPYVLVEGADAEAEALRRKEALSDRRPWEDHGWSKSKLADPVSSKELLRRLKDEWKKQDAEHQSEREIDKAKMERAVQLTERETEELKADSEETKEYLEKLRKAQEKRTAEQEKVKKP